MAKVFRIFVEKKRGNDIEAGQTLADLRDNVGLNALDDLRIINRYYAQGLTEEEFDLAVKQILSEPNLDNVYTELSIPEDYRYFATEFLPGQYDQRADSAAQCIQLLTAGERPVVQYAKIIAVKGDITDDEFEKIKNYIINPVESRVASLEIPESLDIKSSIPADIARIDGFIEMSDEEIKAYHASMGFAMSIADLCWVRDYFKNASIITAASLSFLGLGAQPPTPEWGAMLNEARADMVVAPHVAIFPSLAIFLTVLMFNLFGDGLRDALDPKIDQE